ncbi:MAG: four helix bundle protein [Phycisphaerae bacterium]|nr:four helix bundle protein [Phycisphaerae bacterium]
MELAKSVYHATKLLPPSERFGLMTQMRRAAVSVPSNIAEGNARDSRNEYLHFLRIARGSLAELETQFVICQEPQLISNCQSRMELLTEMGRILQGLIRSLQPPPT